VAVPHSFEDTLRKHDAAIFNWLGGLRVDYGTVGGEDRSDFPILRVFASPDRMFAGVTDLLVRLCWIDGTTAADMRQNADNFAVLPLPIVSITRGDPELDPELRGTPKQFRKRFYNLKDRQWENHPWPAHYRTPYTLNFWMTRRYTEAFIREWVMAQFGPRGVSENETLITVEHDAPWGTFQQALRFDGSSDLSELEGEEPRWIRFEITVNLRTWFMRVVNEPADEVQRIGFDTAVEPNSKRTMPSHLLGEDAQGPTPEARQSENLYVVPVPVTRLPTEMVTTGDAQVAQANLCPPGTRIVRGDLTINVEDQADTVTLGEWSIVEDTEGVALMGVAFQYQSKDGRVELEVQQRDTSKLDTDPAHVVSADSFILPQTQRWEKFHRFFPVRGAPFATRESVILRLAGIPNQPVQRIDLHRIDVRHILSQAKVAETTLVDAGTEFIYQWTSLASKPYLVTMLFAATSGGSGVITVEDDVATPKVQTDRSLDATVNAGAAFLIQPDRDSLALHVPKTITVEDVYIQEFLGTYNGHSVGF